MSLGTGRRIYERTEATEIENGEEISGGAGTSNALPNERGCPFWAVPQDGTGVVLKNQSNSTSAALFIYSECIYF